MTDEQQIGVVTHYFTDLEVGVIDLTDGDLAVGDTVRFSGATTDFTQTVSSMQIDREDVEEASQGDEVALKVDDRVRTGDTVFNVQ